MSDDPVDLDALDAAYRAVADLPSVPIPLYSCTHCDVDYSHPSRDISWSWIQDGWVCDHCWDDDVDGDRGAALRSLDEFHEAARRDWPAMSTELRAARRVLVVPSGEPASLHQDEVRALLGRIAELEAAAEAREAQLAAMRRRIGALSSHGTVDSIALHATFDEFKISREA